MAHLQRGTTMTNYERFMIENPTHPVVLSVKRNMNKPLRLNSRLGDQYGKLLRLAAEAYGNAE